MIPQLLLKLAGLEPVNPLAFASTGLGGGSTPKQPQKPAPVDWSNLPKGSPELMNNYMRDTNRMADPARKAQMVSQYNNWSNEARNGNFNDVANRVQQYYVGQGGTPVSLRTRLASR